MKSRLRVAQGGTSASKTVSIILYLIHLAQSDKTPTLTSIVSESFPHLKRGSIRDFLLIMQTHNYFNDDNWNKSDYTYTFETGSKIEFFSVDQPGKVRGPRRDRLFINEANNIPYEAFDQLEVRTKEFIYLDFNPVAEFWLFTEVKNKRSDLDWCVLTYKDNEALSPEIIASIEQRKDNPRWWKVYGEGQLGEIEGKIYKDWAIIDEIPHEARLDRRGVDFGFSNSPSAIVDVYKYNGGYILDEIAYQTGLLNKQIADILSTQPTVLTIADSAEPKSIEEIRLYGINIIGCDKSKDSVRQGIQFIQDQRISMTKRSVNLIKEYRNYFWMTDKDGKILNEPEHEWSHCFSSDTKIKTTRGVRTIESLVGQNGYLYSLDGQIKRFHDVKPTRKNAEMIIVHFIDDSFISVTPDHLLLQPDGTWIEAQLLQSGDMIQSDMYDWPSKKDTGKVNGRRLARVSWILLLSLYRGKVFQGLCEWRKKILASLCLGTRAWRNSPSKSHTSSRSESQQQLDNESSVQNPETAQRGTPALRGTERSNAEESHSQCCPGLKNMARIRTGEGVAQVSWSEDVEKSKTIRERVCSLPYEIYNKAICKISAFLRTELQDESATKKVKGITRGFCPLTYNLEVDDLHCLVANGIIAHNSMDATRYAFSSYRAVRATPRPITRYANNLLIS